jgi:tRNA A-37 threonylcarbamoyl transferase component Bud32/tetratricopeptide (TPR) repeat protein
MTDESMAKLTGDSWTSAAQSNVSGRYEIIRRLGQGATGVVYEAFDGQRRERVALKALRQFDAGALYRFKHEFRTLADVLHPNLVHLHELVADDNAGVFFTMELVEGTDFLGHVQKPKSQRESDGSADLAVERRAASWLPAQGDTVADEGKLRSALLQLVEGVAALHAAGKLHRDLKPSNVRVTPEGRVVILDFGVATELRRRGPEDDEVVGTFAYMAPEQASDEPPVPASDWYSVGVILYEAIVGVRPQSGTPLEVLAQKSTVDPIAPSARVQGVPEDLNSLCMELLSIDPARRPTVGEILRRLGGTQSDRAPAPQPDDAPAHLVGRDAHLGLLRDAFEATRHGRAVSVRVAGASGMGKSVVLHRFLDELEQRGDALVLRGRAYERESVPYKAVDSVIDALSRHLIELEGAQEPLEFSSDMRALAQVFPVLRRVARFKDVAQANKDDPRSLRQRAFASLRELFDSLARRAPVVVFIDDVHWGDADSAALLVELLRPPAEPPLLLVTTHRVEEADASPFLAELRARWPEDSEAREIQVGPLDPDDARRLAMALLGADGTSAASAAAWSRPDGTSAAHAAAWSRPDGTSAARAAAWSRPDGTSAARAAAWSRPEDGSAQRTADAIARESGGNPFLLDQLAREASNYPRSATAAVAPAEAALSLEQMIGDRTARLPEDARRLLQVIAIGGRPLPVATVGEATGLADRAAQLVALLRARRFVRTGLRGGLEVVEASHDRIRETVAASLLAETARGHHAALARVLEVNPESDPEAIATHLLGAGDRERAGQFAERAAEQAVAKLAFAQAARLLQLRIDTMDGSSPDLQRLRLRMAEASEWAGHPEKAARAYLAAAEHAPALERVDLERAAAAQLIAAGRVDEGAAAFRRVLAAVGRAVPASAFGILFWAVVHRIASRVLLRSALHDAGDLRAEDKVRLNALHAAARALTLVDPLSAVYVKARYLVDALRSRSRFHVVRAAASEAGTLASAGKGESRRERTLFETARRLAEESNDAEGLGLYEITFGISQYLRGRWRSCVELLDSAYERLVTLRRWQANASVYRLYALALMGDLREVKSTTKRLLADAEQRGDLYTAVNLRASHPMAAWLAADDVQGARRHLSEALANWSQTRFLVQHWQCMLWETEAHLYAGEGALAWQRLARDERRLRRSLLLRIQLVRSWTFFVRGRCAVASLERMGQRERGARLAEALRMRVRLEREKMPWSDALAAMLTASVARASRDDGAARRGLRLAIRLSDGAEMALHAAAARYRLGGLVGGDAGSRLVQKTEDAMKARGVRVPARYAQMLIPGDWPSATSPL